MNLPENRLVAIGDVHGCASELMLLLEQVKPTPDTTVVFVGDYVDRGPHSRQAVDLVLELSQQCHVVTLMGNHEAMMLDFLYRRDVEISGLFVFNGGGTTLASYADDHGDYALPDDHLNLLNNLAMFHQTDDHFFVHAGVPEVPLEEIDPDRHATDLIWSRDTASSDFKWSKTIVHGHTPIEKVKPLGKVINIDTGCVYQKSLSAIELPSGRVFNVPRQKKTRAEVLRNKSSRRQAVRFKGALEVLVERRGEEIPFETLDYSALGMFIRLKASREKKPLKVGDSIAGTIGKDKPGMVRFDGIVVRELLNMEGLFYGVKISRLK